MARLEPASADEGSPFAGRRICVIGNGGVGKSTLARSLAECLSLVYIDRDRLVWGPGWTLMPRVERLPLFDEVTRGDGWTYDGHLRASRPEEQLVLSRCDTIVWLDLSRWRVMWSVTRRTLRRVITREKLWNGNVETWGMLFSREFNIRWTWRMHSRLRREYEALFADPLNSSRTLIRLKSHSEMNDWLAAIC